MHLPKLWGQQSLAAIYSWAGSLVNQLERDVPAVLSGKSVLTDSATSTTISATGITPQMTIVVTAANANATGLYVSAVGENQFTVGHASATGAEIYWIAV